MPGSVPAAGEADGGPGVRLALPCLQVGRLVPLQLSRCPLVQARQLQHGTAGGNISPSAVSWRWNSILQTRPDQEIKLQYFKPLGISIMKILYPNHLISFSPCKISDP